MTTRCARWSPPNGRDSWMFPGDRRTVVLASRYPASEEGLVNEVALLLNGRLSIHARREDLAERGLPLTLRGIASLAVMRPPAVPRAAGA